MAYRVRTVRTLDEFRAAVDAITHYFGSTTTEEGGTRFSQFLPFERMHAVLEDGRVVAGAGVFPFALTVPGGPIPCACVTVVGVLPTHRRRGLLTRMMRAQLTDARERGEPIAALWASEQTIYGRYGYGLASLTYHLHVQKEASFFRAGTPDRTGRLRLVDHDEALRLFPRIHERVRRGRPGFIERPKVWWADRTLGDAPERRRGAGMLNRVVFEVDGRPAGYALYRLQNVQTGDEWARRVRVSEAFGIDDRATLEVWRFLLEIDWTDGLDWTYMAVDHPLVLRLARINQAGLRVQDGIWVRVTDVQQALSARAYAGDGRATLEVVSDPVFPDNVGTWTIEGGTVRRSRRRPDVRLDVEGLGSAYLGGFSFAHLAAAGRVEEAARGGLARADALFRTAQAPWCPENF